MARLASFLAEARRRRVFRSAGLYIVGAWVVLQVADIALNSLELPSGLLRYFWLAALAGFPIALIFGWYYEISPEGIRKTAPSDHTEAETVALKVPDYVLIGALAVISGLVAAGLLERARLDETAVDGGIAVLPLENVSGDDTQEYFSAGMHDALISSLSKIASLRVISRTSTLELNRSLSMPEIGKVLGVDTVIEGSVAREGDRVRIIVQLIDAAKDTHIWSESFNGQFTSVLTLQNEMARAIAAAVDVQLSDKEQAALGEEKSVDPDIYDTYMRGMYLVNKPSMPDRKRGIDILEEVVEKDPTNALAYAGLAYGYAMLGHSPFPEGMYPASKLAATRALELDDTLAEAHLSIGMLKLYYEWDFPAAEVAFQRAIDLNPNLAAAYLHYAYLLELYRDVERSLPLGNKSARLDPLSPFILENVGAQYWVAGQYDKALHFLNETLAIDPSSAFATCVKALVYCEIGEFERARESADAIRKHPAWGFYYGVVLARAGRKVEAREFLAQIEKSPRNVVALMILNGTLGNNDEVFRWLAVAREIRLPWYPWFITWFPELASARQDPRMLQFATEIGLEDYL
ncbi:MAG: hypothetical protein JSW21_00225 [Gammaproteobacteria bacterium]|nr:MAG: hypothetical protein JSW21_00225 [Gammaproteobacteria bacterium]